jgi:hypothetical protein
MPRIARGRSRELCALIGVRAALTRAIQGSAH